MPDILYWRISKLSIPLFEVKALKFNIKLKLSPSSSLDSRLCYINNSA